MRTRLLRRLGFTSVLLATLPGTTIHAEGPEAEACSLPLPHAAPAEVGMSAERLARVGDLVAQWQQDGKVAGAVTAVARHGKLVRLEAQGFANLETRRPLRTDDIFEIASMTKPITTVAVLLLVDEGKVSLDAPLERYLPEFRELKVAVPRADAPGGVVLEPAARSITLRDLLTHYSGIPGARAARSGMKVVSPAPEADLAAWVHALARQPLVTQPGTYWDYGPGADIGARVVEVVSGKPFDAFLRERIFAPLGMIDTGYEVPEEKRARRVHRHRVDPGKGLVTLPLPPAKPVLLFHGTSGLSSTAADYLRFCQMLLNHGALDGRRVLSPEAVAEITKLHVDTPLTTFFPGQYAGLGVGVQRAGTASGLLSAPGTYGWSGAHNTYFRIDPTHQVIVLLLMQQAPPNQVELHYDFHNAAVRALEPEPR